MTRDLAKTEAGLVVPAELVEKKQRVMPNDTFKQLKRVVQALKGDDVTPLLVCNKCQKLLTLVLEDRIVELTERVDAETGELSKKQVGGGRPAFQCPCSTRVVR